MRCPKATLLTSHVWLSCLLFTHLAAMNPASYIAFPITKYQKFLKQKLIVSPSAPSLKVST